MKRPTSMTAFGRGEAQADGRAWTVEIRSVNHRFLDTKIRLPRDLAEIEERIKKELATQFSRGHVEVAVSCTGEVADLQVRPNLELARQYLKALNDIKQELALPDNPNLTTIAGFRDVLTSSTAETDIDTLWTPIGKALNAAMKQCGKMRSAEGKALKKEMLRLLKGVAARIDAVEAGLPEIIRFRENSLKERLDKLLNGVDIDPIRLAQEAAIMVDKADITEELTRLRSHIIQFGNYLDLDEPVGRRLDFLLQEFHREINTISSKINNTAIAHQAVELKNDTEKMREQVQNLE